MREILWFSWCRDSFLSVANADVVAFDSISAVWYLFFQSTYIWHKSLELILFSNTLHLSSEVICAIHTLMNMQVKMLVPPIFIYSYWINTLSLHWSSLSIKALKLNLFKSGCFEGRNEDFSKVCLSLNWFALWAVDEDDSVFSSCTALLGCHAHLDARSEQRLRLRDVSALLITGRYGNN